MPWCTIPLGQREDQRSVREWGREAVCFRTPEPHGLPGEEVAGQVQHHRSPSNRSEHKWQIYTRRGSDHPFQRESAQTEQGDGCGVYPKTQSDPSQFMALSMSLWSRSTEGFCWWER